MNLMESVYHGWESIFLNTQLACSAQNTQIFTEWIFKIIYTIFLHYWILLESSLINMVPYGDTIITSLFREQLCFRYIRKAIDFVSTVG